VNKKIFENKGLIRKNKFLTEIEVVRLSSALDELERNFTSEGYFETSCLSGEQLLMRMEEITSHHQQIKEVVLSNKVLDFLEEIIGEKIVLFKDKVNFKKTGARSDILHQDQQAGWSKYSDLFVTMCIAIDENTNENACLKFPAEKNYKHKRELVGDEWEVLSSKQLNGLEMENVTLSPGDAVFFDSYIPHCSDENLSAKNRRNLYITFNKASHGDFRIEYYKDKNSSYPPNSKRSENKEYKYRV